MCNLSFKYYSSGAHNNLPLPKIPSTCSDYEISQLGTFTVQKKKNSGNGKGGQKAILRITRPNEFGSMTARKGDIRLYKATLIIQIIVPYEATRPYTAIYGHTKPYKATYGISIP